jgi:hypothetical protein
LQAFASETALRSAGSARSRPGRFPSSVEDGLGDGAGTSFAWHTHERACGELTLSEPRLNDGWIGPRTAREVTGKQQLQGPRIGNLQQDGAVFAERSLADAEGAMPASNEIPAIAAMATQPNRE